MASRSLGAAKNYARITAVIYFVFVVMGLVPGLDTTFGLVPLHSNDVWLHVLLAVPAAYFGFVHRDNATADRR
jgi:amino acid permease